MSRIIYKGLMVATGVAAGFLFFGCSSKQSVTDSSQTAADCTPATVCSLVNALQGSELKTDVVANQVVPVGNNTVFKYYSTASTIKFILITAPSTLGAFQTVVLAPESMVGLSGNQNLNQNFTVQFALSGKTLRCTTYQTNVSVTVVAFYQ